MPGIKVKYNGWEHNVNLMMKMQIWWNKKIKIKILIILANIENVK